MRSDEPDVDNRKRKWVVWLAVLWVVLINAGFYWQLFGERGDEIPQIWERLLSAVR